jgi:hypothetical protein
MAASQTKPRRAPPIASRTPAPPVALSRYAIPERLAPTVAGDQAQTHAGKGGALLQARVARDALRARETGSGPRLADPSSQRVLCLEDAVLVLRPTDERTGPAARGRTPDGCRQERGARASGALLCCGPCCRR